MILWGAGCQCGDDMAETETSTSSGETTTTTTTTTTGETTTTTSSTTVDDTTTTTTTTTTTDSDTEALPCADEAPICYELLVDHPLLGIQVGALATIDLEGDGDSDVAVGTAAGLKVLRDLGESFDAGGDTSLGEAVVALAVGDLDGDGLQDVVAAHAPAMGMGSTAITVLLSDGAGGLAEITTVAMLGARGLAIGDFDDDGDRDVVAGIDADGLVALLLGDGDGGLVMGPTYTTGTAPLSVLGATVDADPRADVVVGNLGSNSLSVLLGGGPGLTAAASYPLAGSPRALVRGALDDQSRHLIVASEGEDRLAVFEALDDGALIAGPSYPIGDLPRALAAADFDGAGGSDVAIALRTLGSVAFWLSDGSDGLTPLVTYPAITDPAALAVVELSDDGRPDLVIGSDGKEGGVVVLRSTGL